MKKILLLSLLSIDGIVYAMKKEAEVKPLQRFNRYNITLLGTKKLGIARIPDKYVVGTNQSEQDQNARSVYQRELHADLEKVLDLCISFAYAKENGRSINTELTELIKCPDTNLFYKKELDLLTIQWDLGDQIDGWSFENVIEVAHDPTLPNKGTCSESLVNFHNEEKNIHGQVALSLLKETWAQAGKETEVSTFNPNFRKELSTQLIYDLRKKEIVGMAMYFMRTKYEN